MDGFNPVISLLSISLPGLHLLLSVWTPVLMEIFHLLLGVLECLLQLIDLPLLLPILGQVPSDLVLQRILMLVHPVVEDLLLNLPEMIVIVTIDSLIVRDELYPVPYHRDMLLQDSQDDVGIVLLELICQVAELGAHLGILATHLHLDCHASEMLNWLWKPLHLQEPFFPQELSEPVRLGLNLCCLLFEALGLSYHFLGIFVALSSLLSIIFLIGLLASFRCLVLSGCFKSSLTLL